MEPATRHSTRFDFVRLVFGSQYACLKLFGVEKSDLNLNSIYMLSTSQDPNAMNDDIHISTPASFQVYHVTSGISSSS